MEKTQDTIKIGWLCFLNGYIAGYPRRPYVFEIRNGQLLCYINNLKENSNPKALLEELYFACEFIYSSIINIDAASDEIIKYKKYEHHIKQLVNRLMKHTKKAKESVKLLAADLCEQEKMLHEMLCDEILDVRMSHQSMMEEWFANSLEESVDGKVKSNILYESFLLATDAKHITNDMFKVLLKSIIPSDKIIIPKTANAHYTVIGYRLKLT